MAILAVRRGILSPLTEMVAAVSTVADGDLEIEVPVERYLRSTSSPVKNSEAIDKSL